MEPRYRAVKRRIVDALQNGRWGRGEAIPSEPLLARRFGVSIGTVRRAVDDLVAERILVRQQGRGTFVVAHTRDYMLDVFFRIVDRDGRKELPRTEQLSFRRGTAGALDARLLGIAPGDPVWRVRTLQYLQGAPVIVDDLRLPLELFPTIDARSFADRDATVYGLLQQRYGVSVVRTEELIDVATADARSAALLRVLPGTPLLRIRRTGYAYKDRPVETRLRLVSTARHRYLSQLGAR